MNVGDLKAYKTELYTALSRDLAEFEKNFLLLSTGIFAFTISFIKDIVKIETAINLCSLYTSWVFLALAIGLMMFTFVLSANASDEITKTINQFQITHQIFDNAAIVPDAQVPTIKQDTYVIWNRAKKRLRVTRYGAIVFFIAGILFLIFYVSSNITSENAKSKKSEAVAPIKDSILTIKDTVMMNAVDDSLRIKFKK